MCVRVCVRASMRVCVCAWLHMHGVSVFSLIEVKMYISTYVYKYLFSCVCVIAFMTGYAEVGRD